LFFAGGDIINTISVDDLSALQCYFIEPIDGPLVEQPVDNCEPFSPPFIVPESVKSEKKSKKESLKAISPSTKARIARQRHVAPIDKESDEYRDKRDRNNESVRRSRDKARQHQVETETRLEVLSSENKRLQDKVDLLEKELAILRGVFTTVGSAVPVEVDRFLGNKR